MEKMRCTDQTAQNFLEAAQLLVTEILALNLERSNEEIIETYKGFSNDIALMSESVLDNMRADKDFVKNAEEFRVAIELTQPEEGDEDSEAASV